MNNMLNALKIKRQTLAAESQFVRHDELKWSEKARKAYLRQQTKIQEISEGKRLSLYYHRVKVVRPEARKAHIANAYLRGHSYYSVEEKVWYRNFVGVTPPFFWSGIADMVYRFSDKTKSKEEVKRDVLAWRNEHPAMIVLNDLRNVEKIENKILNDFYNKFGDVWSYLNEKF